MKKIAIVYSSKHHGNTYKLVHAISNKYDIDVFDASKQCHINLNQYDIIGFASGIDFGGFYKEVESFAKEYLPIKKKVFFIYTCAMDCEGFTSSMKNIVLEKDAIVLGEYGCKGYNTYGPWKLIGGMNKNHPNEKDIELAIKFFKKIAD